MYKMGDKGGARICIPIGGSTEKKFTIQGNFEWVDVRPTKESMTDFVALLESNACRIGLFAKDDNILTLRMAKDDGGDKYMVAVLKSNNVPPTPAPASHGIGQALPTGSTTIGNGDHQIAGVAESDGETHHRLNETYASTEDAAEDAREDGIEDGTEDGTEDGREDAGMLESDEETHHFWDEAYASPEANSTADESGNEPRNTTAITEPLADADVENTDRNKAVVLTNNCGVQIRVTMERLSCFFNIDREGLAKKLGIGSTRFKAMITQLGLKRWPSQRMWTMERGIEGLEFAIAKGGFGRDVGELRHLLDSVRTMKDELQHGSVEVINRLVKSEVLPSKIRQYLHYRVGWSLQDSRALASYPNQVMEVFAVERSIPEPAGREVRASGAHEGAGGTANNTAPLVAGSGRGRKRLSRAAKDKAAVSKSAGPSAKRFKGEVSRALVLAIQEKEDFGPSVSEEF